MKEADFIWYKYIEKHINERSQPASKIKPTRILVKKTGRFLRTNSGKQVWKRLSDAKNALRFHVNSTFRDIFKRINWNAYVGPDGETYDCAEINGMLEDILQRLFTDTTIIEFVQVDE